jgi:hypothetical protein
MSFLLFVPLRACLLLVALAMTACGGGAGTVDRLTVVNETSYDLEVRITSDERDGWRLLGRTHRGERSVDEQVEDLGEIWIFGFDYGGQPIGDELRVRRSELEADGWVVEVPSEVEDRLRARGVDPSPEMR